MPPMDGIQDPHPGFSSYITSELSSSQDPVQTPAFPPQGPLCAGHRRAGTRRQQQQLLPSLQADCISNCPNISVSHVNHEPAEKETLLLRGSRGSEENGNTQTRFDSKL